MTTDAPSLHLGDIHEAVDDDVVSLHATWEVYRDLSVDADVVDFLNQFCPFAAVTIQDALLDSILLQITRLTDPGDKNLTLQRLIRALPPPPSEFVHELQDKIESIRNAVEPFRQHRNKRIAHTDVTHALADNATLPPFSRNSIERTLTLMREFMNAINMHYRRGQTEYQDPVVVGGGDAIVVALRMAAPFRELHTLAWDPNMASDDLRQMLQRRW